jgi:hypothetical protein
MSAQTLQISCKINTSDPLSRLGFEIRLDNQVIFLTTHVLDTIDFKYDIPDTDGNHCLEFVMKNKTIEDTKIDAQGNIINDACLNISDLAFDGIKLGQIFINKAVYTHNFNGTQPAIEEKFYGDMGCNGTVSIEFSTPVYLWLLENM